MKSKLLLFMSFLFCFSAFLQGQTDGTLTFTFTHSKPASNSQDGDILAVWVEHSNGTFIKAKMRYGTSERDHLPVFALRAGGDASNSTSNIDFSDANTGATLKTGSGTTRAWSTYTVVWDGKDLTGTVVQDGDYKMFIESAWDAELGHPEHDYITDFTFTKGSVAQSLTPTSVSPINTVSLVWTPAALSLDSVYKTKVSLYPNPSNGIINVMYNDIPVSKIDVVNILGQIVKSITLDPSRSQTSQSIDLSGHANRLYIIHVSTNETSSSYKVVLDK